MAMTGISLVIVSDVVYSLPPNFQILPIGQIPLWLSSSKMAPSNLLFLASTPLCSPHAARPLVCVPGVYGRCDDMILLKSDRKGVQFPTEGPLSLLGAVGKLCLEYTYVEVFVVGNWSLFPTTV